MLALGYQLSKLFICMMDILLCISLVCGILVNHNFPLPDFNAIHPNIQITIEKEAHNKLNYLYLTITKLHNTHLKYTGNPYPLIWSHTMTHVTHKNAAINYLFNHMNIYPIIDTNLNHELWHIKTIIHNNNYPTYKHLRKRKKKITEHKTLPRNKKMGHLYVYQKWNKNHHKPI
jgi:hypothetical protein